MGDIHRPLEWTMLARYEVINSHTERWVLRYLNYESIDEGSAMARLWGEWYDDEFKRDCGKVVDLDRGDRDEDGGSYGGDDGQGATRLGRLGMFFSHSPAPGGTRPSDGVALDASPSSSRFDKFLARNNRHYHPGSEEYDRRKSIHDANVASVVRWNAAHAGKTTFVPNEFMDMEVREVLSFRGGRRRVAPRGGRRGEGGGEEEKEKMEGKRSEGGGGRGGMGDEDNYLRGSMYPHRDEDVGPVFGDDVDDDNDGPDGEEGRGGGGHVHRVPGDFDPSSLPESFDWRVHLPGSVGPVKDQGFCGSCWAFSFASSLESNWFVATGQSVDIPEQFVIDCAWDQGSHACDGGNFDSAAHTIVDRFRGLVPTREFGGLYFNRMPMCCSSFGTRITKNELFAPSKICIVGDVYGGYLSIDGECYVDTLRGLGMLDGKPADRLSTALSPSTVQIDSWWYVPSRNEIAVKQALLSQGPLSITLTVVPEMLYYSSGVLDVEDCTKNDIDSGDHAITVVGWGVDQLPDGTQAEHWIVRNSWRYVFVLLNQ